VRVTLAHVAPDVDWVLSGVNHGGNLGVDVLLVSKNFMRTFYVSLGSRMTLVNPPKVNRRGCRKRT
jgi:hypothetical protein